MAMLLYTYVYVRIHVCMGKTIHTHKIKINVSLKISLRPDIYVCPFSWLHSRTGILSSRVITAKLVHIHTTVHYAEGLHLHCNTAGYFFFLLGQLTLEQKLASIT